MKPRYSVDALAVAVGACANNDFQFGVPDLLIEENTVTGFVVGWTWRPGDREPHESWAIVGMTIEAGQMDLVPA